MTIHPTRWLGLDISAATFDATLGIEGAAPELRSDVTNYPRTRSGILACLGKAGEITGVALESTGRYSQEVAEWLREARPGLRVCVLNPMQVKAFGRSLAVRNKNDRIDARVIACFAASHRPEASWVPEPERMRLRELLHEREALVQMLADTRKRPNSGQSGLLKDVREGIVRQLKSAIARIEAGIHELMDAHPTMKADMKRMMTIPGVGPIVAISVLAILGDLRRFQRARQLGAYVGVSPRQRVSGTSVRGRTRMCKQGNSRIRQLLYLAAMASLRAGGPMKIVFESLVARGKARKSALGAVMRRLLLLMRAVLVHETDYRSDYPSGPVPAAS